MSYHLPQQLLYPESVLVWGMLRHFARRCLWLSAGYQELGMMSAHRRGSQATTPHERGGLEEGEGSWKRGKEAAGGKQHLRGPPMLAHLPRRKFQKEGWRHSRYGS